MSGLSSLLELVGKDFLRLGRVRPISNVHMSRWAALILGSAYIALVVSAYLSTLSPGSLSLQIGLCQDTPCVSWVMPAGKAWSQGARPGMLVLSVDGRSADAFDPSTFPAEALTEADLRGSTGEVLRVKVTENPIGQSPMKFSMWALGAIFALLGVAVLLRRPDLYAARLFGLFAGFSAAALTVAPAAGGPAPEWALVVQILAMTGTAVTFLPLVAVLTVTLEPVSRGAIVVVPSFIGVTMLLAYGGSILVDPSIYQIVRPLLFLTMSISFLAGVGLLAIRTRRAKRFPDRRQAQIALWGTAFATTPFVALTLIPEAVGIRSLAPVHISILPVGFMPAAFSYAILRHQLLGIRRLIHRGMVYGIVAFVLLVIIGLVVDLVLSYQPRDQFRELSSFFIATVLVGGVLLFFPLRHVTRWLADTFLYRDAISYEDFLSVVPGIPRATSSPIELTHAITQRLVEILGLESVLLFLGREPSEVRLVAEAGDRADEVVQHVSSRLQAEIEHREVSDSTELRWQSDLLLVTPLVSSGRYLGHLLLGPKAGGEIFLDEEKRMVAAIAPLLAVAIEKGELSEELRGLNRRLINAEESERARIANDIHDGPLQKAALLLGTPEVNVETGNRLANELVSELREICSRLRPAILDDLGLASAIDWLIEGVSEHSSLRTDLSLHSIGDEERFAPELELALFRVTQEATNNVIKHASATVLEVSLSKQNGFLVLRVSDNGVGFSIVKGSNGFGLPGMRERLLQVGGTFQIQSSPGSGTSVVARVPLV